MNKKTKNKISDKMKEIWKNDMISEKCKKNLFQKGQSPWNKGLKKGKENIDLIKKMYLKEKKSKSDIGKELGFSYGTINKRLIENGITLRSRKEVTSLIKNKINEYQFKKGQTPHNKGIKNLKESIKKGKTYEEIYGTDKYKKIKFKIKEARKKQIVPFKDSKIEIKIQDFLTELNIPFLTHQYMEIEHGYQCDILVPSLNLIIEIDGDYWHCNPLLFNKPNEWQLKQIEEDNIRNKELIQEGFKVLRLWEYDIKKMDLSYFKKIIYGGLR
jgi:G:T-mismatch repair DNA endonuclease (very short patch repair protein)